MAIGVAFGLMAAFFMAGLYVAGALGVLSIILMLAFSDSPIWNILPSRAWYTYTEWNWVAIPLFILMGELVLRSGTAERMYTALTRWVGLQAANRALEATLVCSSPPGSSPTHRVRDVYIRSAMPLRSTNSPIKMNSGIATQFHSV